MDGRCECGCGEPTTWYRGGWRRFVLNHDKRHQGPRWREEDRGFVTPCWVWLLAVDAHGYGRVQRDGQNVHAYRAMWQDRHGPVPPGHHLDHLCREPVCVNPNHLESVKPATNVRRGLLARLTDDDAAAIRDAVAAGGQSQTAIGALFGVSQQTVSAIVRDQRWRSTTGRSY